MYGGIGRAARDWECFDAILEIAARRLDDDETLLIQSGKPVGVFPTHADAPRVLLANSNLVPHWATWEHFNELDRKGLMMYGQMTAGSWIYIGTQGIVQGTYETFVEMGRQHYGGDLTGKWILTAGLGGMGGAQPLAATLAGACSLNIECQQSAHRHAPADALRRRAGDRSRRRARAHRDAHGSEGSAISVALLGNAADILPELVRRGVRPDCVTDQTSRARSASTATCRSAGRRSSGCDRAAERSGRACATPRSNRWRVHVEAMLAFQQHGHPDLRLRQQHPPDGASTKASKNAFDFPGFVPAYIRPLFCRGVGPFRWVALSRRSRGHLQDRREGEGADPRRRAPAPLARHGARAHQLPGPAGAHLLGRPRAARTSSASRSTRWCATAS